MDIKEELIFKCKSKERFAQKKLYKVLLPYLAAVVRRYLFDKSFEKDILQESFIKIFRHIDQFDSSKGVFHKWAVRITINTCLTQNTKNSSIQEEELRIGEHDLILGPTQYSKISNEKLLKVLQGMPTQYFEVFNLYVIDEFDHKEIASMLSINEELSRKRLSRGKKWLRQYFNNTCNNPTIKIIRQLFLN